MKKLTFLACLATLCLSQLLAQHQPNLPDSWTYNPDMFKGSISLNNPDLPDKASRDAIIFDCPPHTIYAQPWVVDNFIDGIYCVMVTDETDTNFMGIAFDNFSVNQQTISGVNFWGFLAPLGDSLLWERTSIHMDFIVMTWDTSFFGSGEPNHQFVATATGIPHFISPDIDSIPFFYFDLDFPEPLLLDTGFISIAQWLTSDTVPPDGLFAWMMTPTGDSASIAIGYDLMENEIDGFIPIDFNFCLNKSALIPIRNWPIYLSILLIASFILFRMRKWS